MDAIGLVRNVKNRIVADELSFRRMPFGLCKGLYLPVNLQHDFRTYLGWYEFELRASFRKLVSSEFCCFDIGSGFGYYTLALARLAQQGNVVAVEADPQRFSCLNDAVRRNAANLAPIRTFSYFVGKKHVPHTSKVSLDRLVDENGLQGPDIVKLDVEGAELSVLEGAAALTAKNLPRWVIEIHSKELEEQCTEFLRKTGYQVEIIERWTSRSEFRPLQHNRWIMARHPGETRNQRKSQPARTCSA